MVKVCLFVNDITLHINPKDYQRLIEMTNIFNKEISTQEFLITKEKYSKLIIEITTQILKKKRKY
jgi:flagellar biosynthesis/type III secretory pathway protein FliH